MILDILRDFLLKFATVYLDDVCVYNSTLDEHLELLRIVLQRLKEESLKLRLKNFLRYACDGSLGLHCVRW
jgi:hypothetical protein